MWANSTDGQRKGYFAAGVSFRTGKKLDEHADSLNLLLFEAEQAIEQGESDAAINAATQFAHIAFTIAPFAPKELPSGWEDVLRGWMIGRPMAEIVASDPEELVEFIETGIVYRLVWAVEAVRVRSQAHHDVFADRWTGRLAQTLEAGTSDRCAVILIHAGLGSRVAALAALSDVPGDFTDYQGMKSWLVSESVSYASRTQSWPTAETADLWRRFVNSTSDEATRPWKRQVKAYAVKWMNNVETPPAGDVVRLVSRGTAKKMEIHTPDFIRIGELAQFMPSLSGVLFGKVSGIPNQLEVHYHGPEELK